MRVLNLIGLTQERVIIHAERKHVMTFFLNLYFKEKQEVTKTGIRKLAQLLEYFFDFRHLNNPNRSLGSQTIETELYTIKSELEGRDV